MAKIQIKSEKLTPFGGIFHVMDLFERHLSHIIDGTLGKRSVSIGYDYSEIIRSLMCVYFCYTYRCIMTNDYESTLEEIVEFYNKRGAKERIFDDLNNSFGWNRLPKSFMNENTVFLLITALIRNFYQFLVQAKDLKSFGLKPTSRLKDFTFKFITVPAKWIKTARQFVLNIYTEQNAYATVFKSDFG